LDGVFEGIWTALEGYPAWTVLILDEIDHIAHDSNYDPSEFLYRLLRGEGKLARDIQLSAWLISNELLEVDLRLDSRVESVMSDETVFFPPYGVEELTTILEPQLTRAFREGALPPEVREYGIADAAHRWGDARKTLQLFRRAGETANDRGFEQVTKDCLTANLTATEKDAIREKLLSLPIQHFFVLRAAVDWRRHPSGEIVQPVTSAQVREAYEDLLADESQVGERAMRDVVTDLETMGLIETWVTSRGTEGRTKQVEVTCDPAWIIELTEEYIANSPHLDRRD
jgi:Cdc6-like AAA superfamily ATPase